MPANIIAELIHAGDRLDLVGFPKGEGLFNLGADFTPPSSYFDSLYGPAVDWGQQKISDQEVNQDWGFGVLIKGDTAAEVKRGEQNLQNFLGRAGDESEPEYFAWRPWGDYEFEPVHGTFGKYARYEIVSGYVVLPANYHTLIGPGKFVQASVNLTIKPMSQIRILAAQAAGGIIEDIYKAPNGISRGVRNLPQRTNYFTNPIFDNPTTWNQGWTEGSELYEDQNTDPRYYLFGKSSVRLVYDGTGGAAANRMYLQSINPGSTNAAVISCFMKKVDGAEVEITDFFFVRDGSTIIGMNAEYAGDGWWFLWVNTTGKATAGNFGVQLETAGRYLYMDGFNFEFGSFPSYLVYGDQVGATWAGTPHASTSSRPAEHYIRWPRKLLIPSYSEGTVRVVWQPDSPSAVLTAGTYMLFTDGLIYLRYSKTNNRFEFADGTNSANSGTYLLTQRETIVLHAVFSFQSGLKLYADGVEIASNNNYVLPSVAAGGTYVYLGSNGETQTCYGLFRGFATFDRAMTAAQVLADNNQMEPLIADDLRVDAIPWAWTKAGDGKIDNQNDTAEGNYMIVGGFSGGVITPEIIGTLSTDFANIRQVHFGRLAIDQRDFSQFLPGIEGNTYSVLFYDESGTGDVAASGGAYQTRSLGTTVAVIGGTGLVFSRQNKYLMGAPIRFMGRVRDSGDGSENLQVAAAYSFGSLTHTSDYKNLPALGTTAFGLIDYGQITLPPLASLRPERGISVMINVSARAKRETGAATSNFLSDYVAYMPWPLEVTYVDGSSSTGRSFVLRGKTAYLLSGTWAIGQAEIALADPLSLVGFPLKFEGNKLNLVNVLLGDVNGSDGATITWNLTFQETWLTLRNQIG